MYGVHNCDVISNDQFISFDKSTSNKLVILPNVNHINADFGDYKKRLSEYDCIYYMGRQLNGDALDFYLYGTQ